jgi:EAL domain-containing protein (putative c-di-GMP-specific phosphodiesterase class I)
MLDLILAPGTLRAVFQPIFCVGSGPPSLHALEALTRGPVGTNVESAEILFEYVRRKQAESLADRACVGVVFETARALPEAINLSINVHVSTLARDHEFVTFFGATAEALGIALSRVTVEIVENAPAWDARCLFDALKSLRDIGVGIALDDFGIGESGYRMILDCKPDWLKVDRHFVKGAHTDPHRQAVLRSVRRLACEFGAQVVAEGIEDGADLEAVKQLGIGLVQGYLLCPPLGTAALRQRGVFDHELDVAPPRRAVKDGSTVGVGE